MAKAKTSWREKLLTSKDLPKTIVVPAPIEVDALMKRVPRGKLTTINSLREALARKHGTHTACPMTTGIFAWIAAHAANEAMEAGDLNATPYWRTLKSDGVLNAKYPGGAKEQKRRLEEEGHKVIKKKSALVVADFEKALAKL
ncbi:MAG TPA: hypothetical protein VGP72_29200 [Planctomycetota bacterium]|jgi:hypothetical protein